MIQQLPIWYFLGLAVVCSICGVRCICLQSKLDKLKLKLEKEASNWKRSYERECGWSGIYERELKKCMKDMEDK